MASVIHASAAEFFVEHNRDWGIDALVLIEQVFVSLDLHHVQIWISFAPWKPDRAEKDFQRVVSHLGELKRWLADKIDLRRFPEIELRLSDPEKSFRIMDIFGNLRSHGELGSTNFDDTEGGKEDPADSAH